MKMRKLVLLTLLVSTGIFALKCTKSKNNESQLNEISFTKITDPVLLERIKNFQNETAKKGIPIFSFDSEKEGVKSSISNVKLISQGKNERVTCNGIDATIATTVVYVQYYGDCTVGGNYVAENNSIKIFLPSGSSLVSTTNIPVKYNSGTTTLATTVGNTSGAGPNYILQLADFSFNAYCTASTVDVVCTIQVLCSNGSVSSGDVTISINVASNRSTICKNICPANFQPNIGGNGTVGLNGWYPCSNPANNPCMTYADAIEFYYRKVGVPTWSTYTLNPYLSNAVQINGLSSGNYEYQYRNIDYSTGTTISCYSGFSKIKTVHIN